MAQTARERWPSLAFPDWRDTAGTLHMWTQIVGKVRLVQSPWLNHSWHAAFYVTARGLTTSPIPHGERIFQIDFDFLDHRLIVSTCDGERSELALRPQATADFYRDLMRTLDTLGLPVKIHPRPNEVANAIRFDQDREHASYDPDAAQRFWRILVQVDRVFRAFRAGFRGKGSPVHFFWGSFDLAVTRFSGRAAPAHPGGFPNMPDAVTREAYSYEVSSAGFWTGSDDMPEPIFYAYAYPTPAGFKDAAVHPSAAYWSDSLGEFILPYEAVRGSDSPDATLMAFLDSTYLAAAQTGGWDRAPLEMPGRP
ncbi:MAG: DUF5996 family protein [Alphaproteobacteria bacterium]